MNLVIEKPSLFITFIGLVGYFLDQLARLFKKNFPTKLFGTFLKRILARSEDLNASSFKKVVLTKTCIVTRNARCSWGDTSFKGYPK